MNFLTCARSLFFVGLFWALCAPVLANDQPAVDPISGMTLATIIQSGSTNTRGYILVVHNDGSATADFTGASPGESRLTPSFTQSQSQQFPANTIDANTLHRILSDIVDVSQIPTGRCAKSISFGTSTTIKYGNRTSGDLQCIQEPSSGGRSALLDSSESLAKFVQLTLAKLKINGRRMMMLTP